MFREGRALSLWVHFGLHFGVILGAKFATILFFGRPGRQQPPPKGGFLSVRFVVDFRVQFGIILGAEFATILFFGRPGVLGWVL